MRKIIVAALGAFGGTLGYGYILNAPKNTILPASFIGLAGYIVYILLGMAGFGTMSAYFFSTVFVSVVCELLARKMRTPSTIFLLGALVPLVPGYNFYLAMLALVENLQRRDLDYIEEAEGLQKLMQQYHLSQEQAARRIGKSQSAVANKLRILRHPPSVLQALREHHLTERHARALLRLPDEEERLRVIGLIVQGEWTVAKTEQYIDARLAPKAPQRRELGTFVLRDVRVFLNSIDHQLDLVRAAGVSASRDRQETDREIVLTIRIPKSNPPAAG